MADSFCPGLPGALVEVKGSLSAKTEPWLYPLPYAAGNRTGSGSVAYWPSGLENLAERAEFSSGENVVSLVSGVLSLLYESSPPGDEWGDWGLNAFSRDWAICCAILEGLTCSR